MSPRSATFPSDSAAHPLTSHRPIYRHALWALIALGLLLRFWECSQPPERTGDVYRHLLTGLMVRDLGWSAVAQPLDAWSPRAAEFAPWTDHAYNYPPLALVFFRLVVLIWPTVLCVKLLLTGIEALNTWLVFQLTGCPVTAAVYWCLPVSIWWVSREAQIEPLQNCALLLALVGVERKKSGSVAAWVYACQVKVSAIFMAPYFWTAWRSQPARTRIRMFGLGVFALWPVLLAACFWPVLAQTFHTASWEVTFNQWHWRAIFDARFGGWGRWPLLLWMRIATLALAFVAAWLTWRGRLAASACFSLFLFLGASATMGVFQGWYFCAMVPFVLLARDLMARLTLLVLLQLSEPLSVYQLAFGPIGWGHRTELVPLTEAMHKPLPRSTAPSP